jgi:hypothetical protein
MCWLTLFTKEMSELFQYNVVYHVCDFGHHFDIWVSLISCSNALSYSKPISGKPLFMPVLIGFQRAMALSRPMVVAVIMFGW